jgi:hypothetical protein
MTAFAQGGSSASRFRLPLRTLSRPRLSRYVRRAKRKSRTDQRSKRDAVRLGFLEVPEPHQIAAMSASRWQSARGLMCFSKVSSEDLLLLAGLLCLLCLLSFLSHLALRYPSLVQCKSTSTCIRSRVHHNLKIDTPRFKQGKRWRLRRFHRQRLSADASVRQENLESAAGSFRSILADRIGIEF